jgi:hypothetical protein
MNLNELHSFKLSDAIKFHKELNPKLWKNDQLDPLVKKQLLTIAEDFVEELGIDDLDVVDVTISGSNAAYSYTKHSDLDLHILVNMSELHQDAIYRELFRAKKTLYNSSHDITVHGIPVELYVQDSAEPVVSLGEYSILHDKWIKVPVRRAAKLDQNAAKAKFDQLKDLINVALKTKHSKKISKALALIKRYRQAGLDKGGEFSPENLAFKAVRSQGAIDALYAMRDKLHSAELTIEEGYAGAKMKFLKPGELRGSFTPSKLMALGFKKSQNGSWFILQSKWDELRKTGQLYETDVVAENLRKEFENFDPKNLAEALDSTPYPYEEISSTHNNYIASRSQYIFTTEDNLPYVATIFKYPGNRIRIEFKSTKQTRDFLGFEVTGTGDARKVFATVIDIVKKYVDKHHPVEISFSAKEPSRIRLYDAFLKRLDRELPDYEGKSGPGYEADNTYYHLTLKNSQLDEATDRDSAIKQILKLQNTQGRSPSEIEASKTLIAKMMKRYNIHSKELRPVERNPYQDRINQARAERDVAGDMLKAEWDRFKGGIKDKVSTVFKEAFEWQDDPMNWAGTDKDPTPYRGLLRKRVKMSLPGVYPENHKYFIQVFYKNSPTTAVVVYTRNSSDVGRMYREIDFDAHARGEVPETFWWGDMTLTAEEAFNLYQLQKRNWNGKIVWKSADKQKTKWEPLDEALDSKPYPYEIEEDSIAWQISNFTTSDRNRYKVFLSKRSNKEVNVEFAYQGDDDIDLDIENGLGIKNTGDARRVFATVIEIVKRYANKYKPNMITFSSDPEEPSRMRLYGALVKRADRLLPDYRDISGEIIGSRTHEYVLARKGYQVNEASGYILNKKQNIEEIGFTNALGATSISEEQIINNSTKDGTMGSRPVFVYTTGPNSIYFFANESTIDALVYLYDGYLKGMKNITPNNKGLVYNLFQYLINIKGQQLKLSPTDTLTPDGIQWILTQINRKESGFKIMDHDGNKIDPNALFIEWESARATGKPGPTAITLGEAKNSNWLRENEQSLMPMDTYGATLTEVVPHKHSVVEVPDLIEASGYIPSKKEANDPRFSTALTVDVKPDSIQKNAKAFGSKTSRAGIPPQARADGKIK